MVIRRLTTLPELVEVLIELETEANAPSENSMNADVRAKTNGAQTETNEVEFEHICRKKEIKNIVDKVGTGARA